MVQITFNGVEFYMDNFLASALDVLIERHDKDWDNLGIIDGDEGAGKTTLAWGLGAYLASKTGKEFNIDNIVFDPDELMRIGREKKGQIIIWDEAVIGGLGSEWSSKVQKKLIKILMTCRKNNHFWFFIIPKIFRLNTYIAEDRAFFLINVYSKDHITRGNYVVFNKERKDMLLDIYRNTKKKRYDVFSFPGKFTKAYSQLIDKEAYDKKKDQAIKKMDIGDNKNKKDGLGKREQFLMKACVTLMENLKLRHGIAYTQSQILAGVNPRSITDWRKELEEYDSAKKNDDSDKSINNKNFNESERGLSY